MNKVFQAIILFLVGGMYLAVPLGTVWGWTRWSIRSYPRTSWSMLSLIGFIFATASVVLAISSLIYAHAIGGFPFYDPLLLRIYRTGTLFSLLGILFSLIGVWGPNPLRWHAGFCSTGTLLFWFFSATGE
jgi:hypothetical protein